MPWIIINHWSGSVLLLSEESLNLLFHTSPLCQRRNELTSWDNFITVLELPYYYLTTVSKVAYYHLITILFCSPTLLLSFRGVLNILITVLELSYYYLITVLGVSYYILITFLFCSSTLLLCVKGEMSFHLGAISLLS